MARKFALSTLRTRCQQRCDKENDLSISNSEWAALMSEMYGEMYGIVAASGMRYFETTYNITATGATSYTEPSDSFSLIGIDYVDSAGRHRTLRPTVPQERSRYIGLTGDARRYAMVDDQIFLYPNPSSGTYQVLYIPQSPDLTTYADADLIDVVCPDGEALLIWGVAVKAMAKSDDDASLAIQEREAARARFTQWAEDRALIEPRRRYTVNDGDDSLMDGDFFPDYGFGGWSW